MLSKFFHSYNVNTLKYMYYTAIIKIKNEIKASGGIAPDSLCVICGLSNAAYQRPDGVFVVPITALRN